MVRRLVHEQDVGPAEQHARHGDAHLPAAGQRADVAVDLIVREPEPVQHLAGLALERVAAEVLVLFLHVSEALEDLVHLVGAIGIRHRLVQRLELVMEVADASTAGDGFIDDGPARHLLDVLLEVADRQLLRYRHLAVVRRLFSGDHAEKRRFARAVGTDEADLLARIQLKGGVDEEDLAAVLLVDAIETNHKHGLHGLHGLHGHDFRGSGKQSGYHVEAGFGPRRTTLR